MKKTSLIIGATGYLGKNLAWYLIDKGDEVVCCDIHDNSDMPWMNYSKLDITIEKEISNINFNQFDYIYMFAGLTGTYQGFSEYEKYNNINVNGLTIILNEIVKQKSKAKIIFPSTRLVYKGRNSTFLKETDEKESKTMYALNKLTCEYLLDMYAKVFGVNYSVFRICVPYGNIVPNTYSYGTIGFFLNKAKNNESITLFGDGKVRRTFTHVMDICNVLLYSRDKVETQSQIYNVGGENFSLLEAATIISKTYSVGIDFVEWPEEALKIESGDTIFDDSKLLNCIGRYLSNSLRDTDL